MYCKTGIKNKENNSCEGKKRKRINNEAVRSTILILGKFSIRKWVKIRGSLCVPFQLFTFCYSERINPFWNSLL